MKPRGAAVENGERELRGDVDAHVTYGLGIVRDRGQACDDLGG